MQGIPPICFGSMVIRVNLIFGSREVDRTAVNLRGPSSSDIIRGWNFH
jgi:hypothetical protein